MTATLSPAMECTMRARTLIGLLFTPTSTPGAIRLAFRRLIRFLNRMPIEFDLCARCYAGLRRVQRRLRRVGYAARMKPKAAARVIQLTLDVLQGCRANW